MPDTGIINTAASEGRPHCMPAPWDDADGGRSAPPNAGTGARRNRTSGLAATLGPRRRGRYSTSPAVGVAMAPRGNGTRERTV